MSCDICNPLQVHTDTSEMCLLTNRHFNLTLLLFRLLSSIILHQMFLARNLPPPDSRLFWISRKIILNIKKKSAHWRFISTVTAWKCYGVVCTWIKLSYSLSHFGIVRACNINTQVILLSKCKKGTVIISYTVGLWVAWYPRGTEIFLFTIISKLAFGLTKPPTSCAQGLLSQCWAAALL